jgi:hypothetical protein
VNPKSRTDTAPSTNQMTSTAVDSVCTLNHPNVMARAARP